MLCGSVCHMYPIDDPIDAVSSFVASLCIRIACIACLFVCCVNICRMISVQHIHFVVCLVAAFNFVLLDYVLSVLGLLHTCLFLCCDL